MTSLHIPSRRGHTFFPSGPGQFLDHKQSIGKSLEAPSSRQWLCLFRNENKLTEGILVFLPIFFSHKGPGRKGLRWSSQGRCVASDPPEGRRRLVCAECSGGEVGGLQDLSAEVRAVHRHVGKARSIGNRTASLYQFSLDRAHQRKAGGNTGTHAGVSQDTRKGWKQEDRPTASLCLTLQQQNSLLTSIPHPTPRKWSRLTCLCMCVFTSIFLRHGCVPGC